MDAEITRFYEGVFIGFVENQVIAVKIGELVMLRVGIGDYEMSDVVKICKCNCLASFDFNSLRREFFVDDED